MALEVTTKRNLPKRLARKQSEQKRESSAEEEMGGLVLHLRQRPLLMFLLATELVSGSCSSGWSL